MDWLSQNWLLVLFFGGMIGMHLFGHKGHGKSGGRGCCGGGHNGVDQSSSEHTAVQSSKQSANDSKQ